MARTSTSSTDSVSQADPPLTPPLRDEAGLVYLDSQGGLAAQAPCSRSSAVCPRAHLFPHPAG